MVAAGHRPALSTDLRALNVRLCELERWDLREHALRLCLPEPQNTNLPPRPYYRLNRERSFKVAEILDKVYGQDAPELATSLNRDEVKAKDNAS